MQGYIYYRSRFPFRIKLLPTQGGYVFTSVCLSVCLLVCLFVYLFVCGQNISNSIVVIFMKVCWSVGHRPRTNYTTQTQARRYISLTELAQKHSGGSSLDKHLLLIIRWRRYVYSECPLAIIYHYYYYYLYFRIILWMHLFSFPVTFIIYETARCLCIRQVTIFIIEGRLRSVDVDSLMLSSIDRLTQPNARIDD